MYALRILILGKNHVYRFCVHPTRNLAAWGDRWGGSKALLPHASPTCYAAATRPARALRTCKAIRAAMMPVAPEMMNAFK